MLTDVFVTRQPSPSDVMNAVNNNIQIIGQYRCELGETPVWCPDSQSLLWVDILQQRLLRYWPKQNDHVEVHSMPDATSAVLLTNQPEVFLVVSRCGIQIYDYQHLHFTLLHAWPEERTRPNEAAIAPDGALWFSTMEPNAQYAIGSWYRLSPETKTLQCLLTEQWVPNTLVWTDDGLWFADSLRHVIYHGIFNGDALTINRRYPVCGIPDGSALTSENQLINARWGESCLIRYQLTGHELHQREQISLPVRQPSSCAFGGAMLSDLYITSARNGLAAPNAADGALLKIPTRLTGNPANKFRL
ncbi:SMP-30/gluconolactonase/LRE family protein [Salmonella enterica]|uniref:SMP-30/gluconolactonase/LRE family protein n=1 Tax=Salmonella enterica subsp. enterica serovar Lattenkamp TaxID=2564671 RepID=A0A5W2LV49_SALET|nr:SMP-30/gluconolactonase/LRE family protein [Salmonella enterica subsp. enterica serovar Lattenkamp]EAQ8607487.1 SMP-30/gluconolactonase/LRE family protein [Salmonella enterica]EBY0371929.1 SMP-30/gluconolactonase/LRE family protein [Salmonella enterica subsp. enterica serovar Toulon]ECG8591231.1 SMP-30/gluconolactonase/LRE family protein [Salmonella enterica subsp. salamae]ECJ3922988.1 SMP-30/gluconolactonase/LRE family protein [Salmonella enterica subsp. enterica]